MAWKAFYPTKQKEHFRISLSESFCLKHQLNVGDRIVPLVDNTDTTKLGIMKSPNGYRLSKSNGAKSYSISGQCPKGFYLPKAETSTEIDVKFVALNEVH